MFILCSNIVKLAVGATRLRRGFFVRLSRKFQGNSWLSVSRSKILASERLLFVI